MDGSTSGPPIAAHPGKSASLSGGSMTTRPRSALSRPSAPRPEPKPNAERNLRRRTTGASLLLILAAAPLAAQRPAPPQRGGTPGPKTPQLVVGAFSSADPALGVQTADAVRRRIQDEHSATD